MNRLLRIVGLLVLFAASYLFFVYSMFPVHAIKDRVVGEIEKGLGPGYEISIKDMGLGIFRGLTLKEVHLARREQGQSVPLWDADKVSIRPSWIPALWGHYRVAFHLVSGKGDISGEVNRQEPNWMVELRLKDVNLGQFPILQATTGLKMQSHIDGRIHFNFDPRQLLRSNGEVLIGLSDWIIQASDLKLGEMGSFPVPDLVLSKGKSKIEAKVDKGALSVESLKLEGGDLMLDLKGKVYLSQEVSNYRMNLQGNFQMSPKFAESLSLVTALIEKQKSEDGSYPLTLTGQFSKPNIKIGTFVLPF